MSTCSIFEFRNALCMPYKMFSTLKNIESLMDTLTRSKYFAECRIREHGGEALLYAPIDKESLRMAHRANMVLNSAYDNGFIRLEILNDEMLRVDAQSMQLEQGTHSTLVIERLPEGRTLAEAIKSVSREELLRGLEMLDAELRRYDISHNNLSTDNIIVDCNNRWLPIRQYYTRRGYGGDTKALDALRELIATYHTPTATVDISHDKPWCDMPNLNDSRLHEGRRRRITERGVGFEDEYGRMVIEDKYLAASNFMENRAMVTTKSMKMGLIDRNGREIIEAIYDQVRYSEDSGKSIVVCNKVCAIFDYNGKQLSKWVEYSEVDTK